MGGWVQSFVFFFPIFAVFLFLFFIYHWSDRIGGYLIKLWVVVVYLGFGVVYQGCGGRESGGAGLGETSGCK